MLFRIEVTRSAEADIDAAYLWSFEQSPEYAGKWIRGLYRTIFTLRELPARCPVARESRELGREIRQLLYWQGRHACRILYEIREETVFVLRIRHTAQDDLDPEEAFES